VCDGRKEMPAGVARDYSSYCGNYTFDGTRLVTPWSWLAAVRAALA
jgi:hypothetical protein